MLRHKRITQKLTTLLLNDINTFPFRCTAYRDPEQKKHPISSCKWISKIHHKQMNILIPIKRWISEPRECPMPKVGRSAAYNITNDAKHDSDDHIVTEQHRKNRKLYYKTHYVL